LSIFLSTEPCPSKDSLVRKTSRIRHIADLENKLILQGVEEGVANVDNGLAWSIPKSEKYREKIASVDLFSRCAIER